MRLTLPRLLCIVLVGWALVPAVIYFAIPTWSERGQFGDTFGAVNALFSGLAFAGLFWALQLQREQLELQRAELSLQREELKLTRHEMAASRTELANQVRAQEALVRATAAQIAVASMQLRAEAIKMQSLQVTPGGRQDYAKQIEALADALASLGDRVESGGTSAA